MRALVSQLCSGMILLGALASSAADAPIDAQFFESKIRPVLVESCYKCHSAESERVKGGLLLDSREGLLKGGDSGPAIVPGDPEKSRLIVALRYKDEQLQMPPKEPLSAEVVANFEKWVKAGAPDPRAAKMAKVSATTTNHWAFQPIKNRPAPKVKNRKWVNQPVDAFILADLEERRLEPAPPADKRVLLRRASFDLTGLPPTPEEIDAFLADNSPDAFEKVVDRLLKSAAFGERWGRHWLDLARYSDSNGLEVNTPFPNAYRYRDYVIASFNNDKPYNQFIREQIAGDLLRSTTIDDQHEKWIATGFLVIGPKAFNEPNREKLLADVIDEQIDVTTKSFLGLTVACARCHDHKFDPIPTRDYYALAGIFRSTQTITPPNPNQPGPFGGVLSERPLGNEEDTKKMEEYTATLQKAQEELQQALNRGKDGVAGGIDSKDLSGIVVDNADAEVIGNWARSAYSTNNFVNKDYLQDGNADKGKKIARFRPNIERAGAYEIRLSYTPRYDRATNVPVTIFAGTNVTKKKLNEREAPKFDKAFAYLGLFDLPAGTNSVVEISNEGTKGFVVVDAVQFLPLDNSMNMAMAASSMQMQNTAKKISETYAGTDLAKYGDKVEELRAKAPPPLPAAMAVRDASVQNARIAIRGDVERLGDEVPRGFIQVIDRGGMKKTDFSKDHSGRLELAEWIASPENPLTARVFVNRVWQHLFGRAIVNTPDNFGLQGDAPSNPELLDYLATRFVQEGWSVKKLIREITLSSAYQMGNQYNPSAYAKDPDNKLVWRMDRKRLEAEAFRDAILAVSGQLEGVRGGPALPQRVNNGPPVIDGNIPVQPSARRSVYLATLRNNLDDLFLVFDFPDPHTPIGKRHVTSAATQALYVMNSPFVQDQAKAWAQRLDKMSNLDDAGRVTRAFVEAFAREPSQTELLRSKAFINEFMEASTAKEPDTAARKLLAWQSFCQALVASAEFRYLN